MAFSTELTRQILSAAGFWTEWFYPPIIKNFYNKTSVDERVWPLMPFCTRKMKIQFAQFSHKLKWIYLQQWEKMYYKTNKNALVILCPFVRHSRSNDSTQEVVRNMFPIFLLLCSRQFLANNKVWLIWGFFLLNFIYIVFNNLPIAGEYTCDRTLHL